MEIDIVNMLSKSFDADLSSVSEQRRKRDLGDHPTHNCNGKQRYHHNLFSRSRKRMKYDILV